MSELVSPGDLWLRDGAHCDLTLYIIRHRSKARDDAWAASRFYIGKASTLGWRETSVTESWLRSFNVRLISRVKESETRK